MSKSRSPLTRQQKLFKLEKLFPLDANNLIVEEAIGRLFVYLRTNGRIIRRTDKNVFLAETPNAETPEAVMSAVLEECKDMIKGVDNEHKSKLLTDWFESHFALMSRRGKSKGGDYRMSGLRPLHFMVIKLFNPQVKGQDRNLSGFFYNALKDDPTLTTQADSLLRQFFAVGIRNFGDNDYQIDEAKLKELAENDGLDIELLFLMRVLQPFDTDKYGSGKNDQVADTPFLCPEQIELMKQDLRLLFFYKDCIPRRELISYMTTLLVFHASLYFYQIVRMSNAMIATGEVPEARGELPRPGEPRNHCPFDLNFFCDLTNGHNSDIDELSKQSFISHYQEIEEYFRSAYTLKKLDEFAEPDLSPEQRKQAGRAYFNLLLGYLNNPGLDGHFNRDIRDILDACKDEETGDPDPEIQRIIDVCNKRGLGKLQTFVEILYQLQYRTLREQHRKLIAALCGSEQDRGFMWGKGRARRKYFIGNELLEVLIQLSVLEQRAADGKWQTRPIPIRKFVDWLKSRYGLLIDTLGDDTDETEVKNRALAANYDALKTRLRQLGFFTDLADASNSQTIEPRFRIVTEDNKTESVA
ncbi:methylation-associated defense system protein MAD7 [Gimesia maris]|uniref:methylation-associated defense system protein MAD7 n=1 Tax=Gimesia maris TaxID=122 RepID=UPI0032EEECD0